MCSCFLFSETTKLTIRSFRRYLFYIMFLDLEVFQSISIFSHFGIRDGLPIFVSGAQYRFCMCLPTMAVLIEWKENLAHVRWETLLRNSGVVDIELNQALTVKIPLPETGPP